MALDLSAWKCICLQRAYWCACFSAPRLSARPNLGGTGFIGHALMTWLIENVESMSHSRALIDTAHQCINVDVTTLYCAIVALGFASLRFSRRPAAIVS